MNRTRSIIFAFLITTGQFTITAVPIPAQEAGTTNLSSAGNLVAEEITIMLPGDVPLVMVRVPAGTFMMGSPEGERGNVFENETQHQVTLTQDYYLGKTEVTQQQWEAVMGTPMRAECGDDGVGDDYPVYCVTWDRIAGPEGFLERLNEQQGSTSFRLPTEAEWERAARAETTTRFSHGDVLECGDDCEACAEHEPFMWWCGDDSPTGPKPVGQKQANQFGLHDMHGNIFEIVNDLYGDFTSDPVTDPTGPTTGFDIVIKGGSWENEAWLNRSAVRLQSSPDDRAQNNSVGFRLAVTANAELAFAHRSFFPAVAVAAGAEGAFFQTDLDINNTAPADAKTAEMDVQYELWWLPRGEDNSDPAKSEPFTLAAGEGVRIENVLTEIFGLEPDEVGALAIAASSPYLIGMSRTYNIPAAKAAGTFGQALPAVPEDELIRSGDTQRIIFMSEDSDFRANLGCVNGTDMAIRILIDMYDASGSLLETKTMNLGPWSNKQINRIFSAYQPVNGYVDVRSNTEGAEYYCYGSVLDNVTSDPTTILPQEPSSGMRYYVPAAALAAGAEGAFFQTDVDVNNSGIDTSYVFMWLPRGEDNSSPAQSDSWNLDSGMSARYQNVLSEVFAAEPDVVGALGLESASEDLLSMSRTYNVPAGEGAGTFGQALPGIQEGDMIGADDRRRIIFLSENDDLRANVGCASGAGVSTQITIELFNAEGESLATRNMQLGPWSNKQLNRIFSDFSPVNGYVDVWSETEGALFYCYGSVLDNATSDPTTILPQ
jgi:formylglycine-generating enzyme required for sulfatase activity